MAAVNNDLSRKQKLFVQEYLIDLNATQAAVRAGYSPKTATEQASRLLTHVKVSTAIQNSMNDRSERTGIDSDYVLSSIHDTVERCKQSKPVTYKNGDPVLCETPDGKIVPAYSFDSGAVLKGCELLGKHLKMFTDKVEHSGAVTIMATDLDEDI
ncbi:MAG: terminase small subunit [Desulfobacterales bacterium]